MESSLMDLDRNSIPIGRIIFWPSDRLTARKSLFSKRLIGVFESGYVDFRNQIVYFRKTCRSVPQGVRGQN